MRQRNTSRRLSVSVSVCVCVKERELDSPSPSFLSLCSALLFFCGSLQFGLVSLLRSFGRRRRSSRRHHGASLSLSPSLSLSCTQIMAFAKLDPGSFSGFLLLLLLSASLVWARDHVDYNYIRKVAIQIRWNSIRRISWLAPFESERSSQLI